MEYLISLVPTYSHLLLVMVYQKIQHFFFIHKTIITKQCNNMINDCQLKTSLDHIID